MIWHRAPLKDTSFKRPTAFHSSSRLLGAGPSVEFAFATACNEQARDSKHQYVECFDSVQRGSLFS